MLPRTGYLASQQSLMDQAESENENESTEAELNALSLGAESLSGRTTGNLFTPEVSINNTVASVVGGMNTYEATEVNNDDLGRESNSNSPISATAALMGDYNPGTDNPAREAAQQSQQQLETLRNARQDRPSEEIIERMRTLVEPPSPSANDGEVDTAIFNYYNDRADLIELQQTESESFLYDNLSLSSLIEDSDSKLLLLSHENYKISMQPEKELFGKKVLVSNGSFISPEQLYLLKKGYIENKLESFSNRYFLKDDNSKKSQSLYLQNIKQNNTFKKNYITNINKYLNNNSKNIKKFNFGNQLLSYAKDNEYSNYFGKVVNKVYNNNTYNSTSSYTNNSFSNINEITHHNVFDKSYHTNLKSTLKNYYKLNLNIDENSSDSFFYRDDILNSNAIIMQCLNFSASSLKNIHEGSFTSINYDNTSDLNFSLYDTLTNNATLNRVSILPYSFNYDIFKSNHNNLDFTCAAYTNTLGLTDIKLSAKERSFKSNSNYVSENYSSDKIQVDHFKLTNMLQRSENSQSKNYLFNSLRLANNESTVTIKYLLQENHNWLFSDQFTEINDPEILLDDQFLFLKDYNEILGIDPVNYLQMQYNVMDTDAVICQMNLTISGEGGNTFILNCFDNESQLRNYSDSETSNIKKYLSCPTFNMFQMHQEQDGVYTKDTTFDNFSNNYLGHKKRSLSCYFNNQSIKSILSKAANNSDGVSQEIVSSKIFPGLLNFNQKKFSELDSNRIMFAYGIKPDRHYNDNINPENFYKDELSYFIDRTWSIKQKEDDVLSENKSGFAYSPRNLDFRQIGYGGAAERFSDGSASGRNILDELGSFFIGTESLGIESYNQSIPSIKNGEYAPFVLLKNTNKAYNIKSSDLKDKYLLDESLTTSEELFYDRVQITSSTRSRYLSDGKKNVFKKYQKLSAWKSEKNSKNNWVYSAFKLKRDLFRIKKKKIGSNSFLNFLEEVNRKNNKLFNNNNNKSVFSLIHEDKEFEGQKLYSLEESPFLIKKSDNVFVEKNNYKNSFDSKILTTNSGINLLSNDEVSDLESFTNINEFKNFLNEYYPESCLKNSSSLIQKMFTNLTDVFNKYTKSYIKDNKEKTGFEDLIVSSLISNRETFNFLYYAIIENKFKERQLNDESSNLPGEFYKSENSKSENLYNQYLTNIFKTDNVKKQNTFTLRVLGDKFLSINKLQMTGGQIVRDSTRFIHNNRHRRGNISIVDGRIKNYLFPYKDYVSIIGNNMGPLGIPDANASEINLTCNLKFFSTLLAQTTYNYDVYLHSQSESLFNTENIANNSLNISCKYIVLPEIVGEGYTSLIFDGSLLNLGSSTKEYKLRSFVKSSIGADNDISGDEFYERLPGSLLYEIFETAKWDKDFTFELIEEKEENKKTFLASLANLVEEILNYTFTKDFLKETKTTDILNDNIFDDITNIILEYVKLYKSESDKIRELSIFKNLNSQIRSRYTDTSMQSDFTFIHWDDSVKNQIMLSYTEILDMSGQRDYNINNSNEKFSESETNIYSNSQQVIDNKNILSLFKKSDYLESLTHDLIFGYLLNFEDNKTRLLDTNREKLNLEEDIKEKSQEIVNIQGDINFTDFYFNRFKICKASKLMQNKAYYSIVQESNIDAIMRNRISNSFDNFKIFETKVKFEKNKKELAEHALDNYFLPREGLSESFNKIDILRFGINYNLANSLGVDKILVISVYPINHKYPEVRIPHFEFLYTPILTDIMPAYLNTSVIGDLNNKLGLYDINSQRFDLKYRLADAGEQFRILYTILQNIEEKRTLLGFEKSLKATYANIERIKTARKISNAIKYLNDSYNSVFDDANINELDIDFDNIISDKTKVLFDEISETSFNNIFSESKEEVDEFLIDQNGYFDLINKKQQIEKNIHSTEFFKSLDENTSNLKFLQPMTNDSFFDIFSVRISRDAIRNEISDKLESLTDQSRKNELSEILSGDDFSNSYSYIIQTKVF